MYPSQASHEPLPFGALGACGAVSGAFTSLLLTPIELVKCKVQVPALEPHTLGRQPTVLSVIRTVYAHRGLAGFWHGQMGTLIRETGGSAAWFGSYEGVKILFKRRHGEAAGDQDLAFWNLLVAGAVAGMGYNFIFYPADTIKSRMQTEDVTQTSKLGNGHKSFWAVGRQTWCQQGVRGLYRGCGITVARAAPSSALIFTIYEALKKHFA